MNMVTQVNRAPQVLTSEITGKLQGQGFKDLMSQHLTSESSNKLLTEAMESFNKALRGLYQKLMSGDLSTIEGNSNELIDSLKQLNQLLGEGFEEQLLTLIQDQTMMNKNQALELIGMVIFKQQNQASLNGQLSLLHQPANDKETNLLAKIIQLSEAVTQGQTMQQNSKINLPKDWMTKWANFVNQVSGKESKQQTQHQVSSQLVKAVKNLLEQSNSFQEYKLQLPRQSIQQVDSGKVTLADQPAVSKQEQLVIHLSRQSQSTTSQPQQQLIEQLQKMIQQTRFSQLGGQKQLSIQLKPANLGDMSLKFTQIDGQMAVKITVSTQVAKEMIEGNMQQLRHLFSPNQVVVERQAESLSSDEQQLFGQEEQSSKQQGSDHDEQEHSHANDEQSGKSFKDLLFEEEV